MGLTHFSLFTGIGGIDLAAEWAGFETVGQVEWADYQTEVLEKHWPNVPRWRDIRDVNKESIKARGIGAITVISGGFPCQPFSTAGKRKGKEDDRYLWPEMLRVIQELQPNWVIGENVAGIIDMALDQVLSDLENQNYETQAFIIPAVSVNAPHRRDRVFILAHSNSSRFIHRKSKKQSMDSWNEAQFGFKQSSNDVANTTSERLERNAGTELQRKSNGSSMCSKNVPNTESQRQQREWTKGEQISTIYGKQTISMCNSINGDIWATEPLLGRVANGIPNRVDRIKCLGNAVVPQQVYPILQAIADIELSNRR